MTETEELAAEMERSRQVFIQNGIAEIALAVSALENATLYFIHDHPTIGRFHKEIGELRDRIVAELRRQVH